MLENIGVYDINIFSEQMIEDINALEYILNCIYSGSKILLHKGISISETLNTVRNQLKSVQVMNCAEFFDLLCGALRDIRDSHLVFTLPYFCKNHSFCTHSTVYFADAVLNNTGRDYTVKSSGDKRLRCGSIVNVERDFLFKTSKSEFLIGALSEKTITSIPICCNGSKTRIDVFPLETKPEKAEYLWKRVSCHGIDIVEVRSLAAFSDVEMQQLEDFVSLGKELKNSTKIILDLRGNKGGDSDIARRFIENLNGTAIMNLNYTKCDSPGSRLAEICFYAKNSEEYAKIRNAVLANKKTEWKRSVEEPYREGSFKNTLLIITDRNTASSAEIMVKCLKDSIPQSIVIGENTSGTLSTGDIRYFYLPNSKIFLNIPTANFSGILEEGIGILPDYWCNGDALQYAKTFEP